MTYKMKLKSFAEELVSEKLSDEKVIQSKMEELGLKYTPNELERFNQVLLALHNLAGNETKEPNKEIRH